MPLNTQQPQTSEGWIGVDLDGTLAEYYGWVSEDHIGPPIAPMVARVKQWLAEGKNVRIFTARIDGHNSPMQLGVIEAWCREHLGQTLPVTCTKDYHMVQLWDDRCVQVVTNTGLTPDELRRVRD